MVTSNGSMNELQSLVDSMSLSAIDNRQMDQIADALRDRLEVDLGTRGFRDLAEQLVKLSLEKRQTGQSDDDKEEEKDDKDNEDDLGETNRSFHPPLSSSSSHAHLRPAASVDEGSLMRNKEDSALSPNVTTRNRRGRSPARKNFLIPSNTPRRRERTPVHRSSTGHNKNGNKTPPDAKRRETRRRSPSPFNFGNMLRMRKAAPEDERMRKAAPEDEKKETENPTIYASSAPTATSTTPERRPPLSGRESPSFDPSAEQPMRPPRPESPAPTLRDYGSSTNMTGRFPRPQSPYSRPGLQDGDDETNSQIQHSPRPCYAARSRSVTPTRRGHDEDDDDDSVKQPPCPRSHHRHHRRSLSSPDSAANTNLFFGGDNNHNDLVPPEINGTTSNVPHTMTSAADAMGGVETILTPPITSRSDDAATANNNDEIEASRSALNKTGKGKMRRKGGTPPFSGTGATNVGVPPASAFAAPQRPVAGDGIEGSRSARRKGGTATASGTGANAGVPPTSAFAAPQRPVPSFAAPATSGFTNAFQPTTTSSVPASFPTATSINEDVRFNLGMGHATRRRGHPASRRSATRTAQATVLPRKEGRVPQQPPPPPPNQSTIGGAAAAAMSPPVPMDVDPLQPSPENAQSATFSLGVANDRSARSARRKDPALAHRVLHQFQQKQGDEAVEADDTSVVKGGTPESGTASTTVSTATLPSMDAAPDLEAEKARRTAVVANMRNEARTLYVNGDYRGSILMYNQAIQFFHDAASPSSSEQTNDTLAVLLSNRAACLLMIGSYEAASSDCRAALPLVSVASESSSEPFSTDSGPLLMVKLLTRLARALLKQGDHNGATEAFDRAINEATSAATLSKRIHPAQQAEQNQGTLSQMMTEATLGRTEAHRLRGMWEQITKCTLQHPGEKRSYAEALGHVNMALSTASGSIKLFESKLTILASMKRWREAAGFLERLAASHVKLDGVFVQSLESKNPFPGVPPARFLTANFFGNTREDDVHSAEAKLNSRAAAEAVLRLPYSLTPFYLRALRLEERYPAADSALHALEELVERDRESLSDRFTWLARERGKLARTKTGRERGDELFRLGDFDLAAAQYGACLTIDGEGLPDDVDGGNAGGRLHAVLHCNRAACLMAVRRFHEAIEDCTAALRIHSRYMKAMLRRSRCYMRLHRYEEAISEYKRWLELVEEARASTRASSTFVTPCIFDGPKDVSDADFSQVKRELEEVHRSKRRAEATAREEASRHRDRHAWREGFSRSSWTSSSSSASSAQQQRDKWYNQQNDSRRWDSFADRRPRGTRTTGSGSNSGTRPGHNRSRSWGQQRRSPGSDPSIDHYTVLEVRRNASDDEIKKRYRRLALQYHPDKNKSDGAADKFRRVKLAYETLSDPVLRRKYDSELQVNIGMF